MGGDLIKISSCDALHWREDLKPHYMHWGIT